VRLRKQGLDQDQEPSASSDGAHHKFISIVDSAPVTRWTTEVLTPNVWPIFTRPIPCLRRLTSEIGEGGRETAGDKAFVQCSGPAIN